MTRGLRVDVGEGLTCPTNTSLHAATASSQQPWPGFLVVRIPDSTFARITGLIPLTSSAVMPARIAMTEVPVWEIVLSALLLLAGALAARRTAGKVFAVAMLMHGKEPSWGEIRRWAREG